LIVITDPQPACGRPLHQVVAECLEAGAPSIQLRDKTASAEELYDQALGLVPLAEAHGALLMVNDRFDVARAAGAHGVHLGPEDLPVEAVRRHAPAGFLIGYSTDDPELARAAAAAGADYLGVGAVFATQSKEGLEGEAIGPGRVAEVLAAAALPGVGIGGITQANAQSVAGTGAGVAALGSVMQAPVPGDAVRALLAAVDEARAALA
jgi:thiamine-phosphate pyrophosphorylase